MPIFLRGLFRHGNDLSVESMSIAMVTVPHSRILINVSPGAGLDIVLDVPLCLSVLTSGIKWMQCWTGERWPDIAAITQDHHLSLCIAFMEVLF